MVYLQNRLVIASLYPDAPDKVVVMNQSDEAP